MDITGKTVEELKVIAYDLMVLAEQTQQSLQTVSQAIVKQSEETK